MNGRDELRIICPNGHLGFAMSKEESFKIGVKTDPDYYCCDSGSVDIGPVPLALGESASPYVWQKHDIEMLLLAARSRKKPMLIGSAGDTGEKSRVDMYVQMIRDLAEEHSLEPFKVAYFYSDISIDYLREKLRKNDVIEGLDGRGNLTLEDLDQTTNIVAMAGVHPFLKALEMGADVIIGGRSSDAAIFAAPAIKEGFPEALAYYLGKVLECASFCAEPYAAKESVIGTISHEDVKVTAMSPYQRCTTSSVAGHAMYERSNPFYEFVAGGMLDMRDCHYEQYDEKTCRITGPRFVPADQVKVKLEGSGIIGERFVGLAGIRDPYSIKNIDKMLEWSRQQVEEKFGTSGYELHYTIYGKNGVMGELEPLKDIVPHELCVVTQGIAPTKQMAEEVAMTANRQIFYARLPEVKGTAGSAAFLFDEVLPAKPACRWTINHLLKVNDPMELFKVHMTEIS